MTSHDETHDDETPNFFTMIGDSFGRLLNPSDLPPELRARVRDELSADERIPAPIRERLVEIFSNEAAESERETLADHEHAENDAHDPQEGFDPFRMLQDFFESANGPQAAAEGVHECGHTETEHAEEGRRFIWHKCDSVFPEDPHLWNALESLLVLDKDLPLRMSSEERIDRMEHAIAHLQAQIQAEQNG